MLVVDAGVALNAAAVGTLQPLKGEQLVAPPFMWAEARSALHEAAWRGEVASDDARATLEGLESLPIGPRDPKRLGTEAWKVADQLGWAKTYDAEYVVLARLLRCRLVTLDVRLRRGTGRLGFVVLPSEL